MDSIDGIMKILQDQERIKLHTKVLRNAARAKFSGCRSIFGPFLLAACKIKHYLRVLCRYHQ
jgi:hypothetical protein